MNEEAFKEWWYADNSLKQNGEKYAEITKQAYMRALKQLEQEQGINVFESSNIDFLNEILERLEQGDLQEFNQRHRNTDTSNGLKQYIKFLDNIDYEGFKKYLQSKNYAEKTVRNNVAYIKRTLDILKNFEWFNGTNNQKILKFSFQDHTFKKEFDKFNPYNPANDSTFTNFRESARKYKDFLLTHKDEVKMHDNLKKQTNITQQNIILYGAPGIGKTYNYKNLISMIENQEKSQKEIFDTIANNSVILENSIEIPTERVAFITFHQSYSYEDFIEGFRPQEDGTIQLKDGIFKEFCDTTRKDKEQNYYLVIDEINRGNISKIFGELITLIEEDKREELSVILPYSKQPFSIPKNLYIIATMNSTDKSIATIDIALRRRFTFIKMKPNPNLVKDENTKLFMQQLNKYIEENLGKDYLVGHSYFMSVETQEELEFVKEYKIKPLLEEYFYVENKDADTILKEIENKENQ
jgi:5-methylcytosine-specific restriction protein B